MRVFIFLSLQFLLGLNLWSKCPAKRTNESCQEWKKCFDKDFRDQLGPLRNQDSVGYCHAYTKADLLAQYLERNKEQMGYRDVKFNTRDGQISAMAIGLEEMSHKYFVQSASYNYYREIDPKLPESTKYIKILSFLDDLEKNEKSIFFKKLPYRKIPQLLAKESVARFYKVKGDVFGGKNNQDIYDSKEQEIYSIIYSDPELIRAKRRILEISRLKRKLKEMYLKDEAFPTTFISPNEGGYIKMIFEHIYRGEYCQESNIKSTDYKYAKAYHQIKNLDLESNLPRAILTKIYEFIENYSENKSCDESIINPINMIFNDLSSEQIQEILSGRTPDIFKELLDTSDCKIKIPRDKLPINRVWREEFGDKFEFMDDALDNGAIVGISWAADILSSDEESKNYNHGSSIVGKELICGNKGEEVYYILRNSWGRDSCSHRQKRYVKKYGKEDYLCENGYYKIKKSHLGKGLEYAMFLEDR